MTTDQKRKNADFRARIMRIFSPDPVVREDALLALREAWEADQPSFRAEELASNPADNCVIMAATRDGHKQVVDWLAKFHH